MKRTRIAIQLLAASALAICGAAQAQETAPGSNVLFIFDSSGSMKKKLKSGETRSEAAKSAMIEALGRLPENARPGLMMYGHRRAKDCSDIETVAPVGSLDAKQIAAIIRKSKPKGETPIADSLLRAAAGYTALKGQANSIVLVTDGIEECGGDPCAAARAVSAMGLAIKAHVVGFTLNEQQRTTVQCIADETGGKYFDAQNAESLAAALEEVQEVVAEPPAPTYTSLFRDDFDGAALMPHWALVNSRDDGHIVENGKLLVASALGKGQKSEEQMSISLSGFATPADDWIAQAVVDFGMQTAQDGFTVFLVSGDTKVSAELGATGDEYYGWTLFARISKVSDGETVVFDVPIKKKECNVCKADSMLPALVALVAQPIELQLVKEGRNYYARARESGGKEWLATDKVTMLTSGGTLAISGFQRKENPGESYAFVDTFEILKKDN
jgi:hypothetical protein